MRVLRCPICQHDAKVQYACGDYFIHCSGGCQAPMCDHATKGTTIIAWNDWAKWYAVYIGKRTAQELPTRWIPVSERLPEDAYGCLLVVEEDNYCHEVCKAILPYFAGYDGTQWNDGDGERIPFEVTHWMALPAPPKEDTL